MHERVSRSDTTDLEAAAFRRALRTDARTALAIVLAPTAIWLISVALTESVVLFVCGLIMLPAAFLELTSVGRL